MSPEERVRGALAGLGIPAEVVEMEVSTATAQAAADACGCELGQILKTLLFMADGRPTTVLAAGDRAVNTALLAPILGVGRKKLRMGTADEVMAQTGFAIGGVAPVGHLKPSDVVLDESLRRFEHVWAAAGSGHSVFRVATETLAEAVGGQWAEITREQA